MRGQCRGFRTAIARGCEAFVADGSELGLGDLQVREECSIGMRASGGVYGAGRIPQPALGGDQHAAGGALLSVALGLRAVAGGGP